MCSNPFTSKAKVFSLKKWRRFTEAKLQAVLSKNMYSEHGLDALMRPPSGQVCHSLMVVSYCTPGSAQAQAANATSFHNFSEGIEPIGLPVVRAIKSQFFPSFNAWKKVFGIRIELLEFWPATVR